MADGRSSLTSTRQFFLRSPSKDPMQSHRAVLTAHGYANNVIHQIYRERALKVECVMV